MRVAIGPCVVGLRDRAVLAILAYTSSRAGAAAKLRRGDFYDVGDQWMLRFTEKGGKSREIPVRHGMNDVCRMMKRRLADASLSSRLSPHSFRVAVITDLLEQGVPLEDVQHAGRPRRSTHHAALRSPAEEGHAEHRGANFDLTQQQ